MCGGTVPGMPFVCANQKSVEGDSRRWKDRGEGVRYGLRDLRKWPVGCRVGVARFVLGGHARIARPGPDGVFLASWGGRAAGNGQGWPAHRKACLCALASESGLSLGPVCDGD